MKREKVLVGLSVFLVFILMISTSGCLDQSNKAANSYAENFSFYLLNGDVKKLSDFEGKVVILDMWATWCSPCKYQMLELKKAYGHYSKEDLVILSINKMEW